MNPNLANEIISCLPEGRTLFFYFKDRYALMLLKDLIGKGMAVREIKQSPFAKLLDRPLLRSFIEKHGNRPLTPDDLDGLWPNDPHCYLLTLGVWGEESEWASGWSQTSRPGTNLVLQLNFSNQHNAKYKHLIDKSQRPHFGYSGHPVAREGFLTLAWARIDLDFETNEALIEEVQSDWIYETGIGVKMLRKLDSDHRQEGLELYAKHMGLSHIPTDRLGIYLEEVMAPHIKIWNEAMLAAAIDFLKDEIGIRYIFYHTYETGRRIKRIPEETPPRSLYTQLPKAFCLQPTAYGPEFLIRHKDKQVRDAATHEEARFFLLPTR